MAHLQQFWNYLQDINAVSTLIRIVLAALAGGLVGIERAVHGRAAGLRTHMLVSLGAALTAMIGLFLTKELGIDADATRIAAQVMSGLGFLGAGTILLKKGNSRITGLTTAAGLWATAAIGLAVGYGFYLAAYVAVAIVILTFAIIPIESRMTRTSQKMFVYLELDRVDAVQNTLQELTAVFDAQEIQVTAARSNTQNHVGIEALIRIPPKESHDEKLKEIYALEHVIFVLPIH